MKDKTSLKYNYNTLKKLKNSILHDMIRETLSVITHSLALTFVFLNGMLNIFAPLIIAIYVCENMSGWIIIPRIISIFLLLSSYWNMFNHNSADQSFNKHEKEIECSKNELIYIRRAFKIINKYCKKGNVSSGEDAYFFLWYVKETYDIDIDLRTTKNVVDDIAWRITPFNSKYF